MTLVQKASLFIENLFKDKLSSAFLYHNYKHTQEVVTNAEAIANAEGINEHDKEILLVACWFHDSGYTEDINFHEEKSCEIAEAFLKGENLDENFIHRVKMLIMSTKICNTPKNHLEEIIRDADSSHLASPDYFTYAENLKKNGSKHWKKILAEKNGVLRIYCFFGDISFVPVMLKKLGTHKRRKIYIRLKK